MYKKNIAFLHEEYPFGGAEKVTSDVGQYLAMHGFNIYIFTCRINEALLNEEDKKVFTFVLFEKKNLFNYQRNNLLVQKARDKCMDVIIFVGGHLKVNHHRIARSIGCKYIFSLHGTPFWEIENLRQSYLRKAITRKMLLSRWKYKYYKPLVFDLYRRRILGRYHSIYKKCDAFTVLTQSYKDTIRTSLRLSDARKIHVIPNAQVTPEMPYSTKKKNQIIYVGRLSYTDKRADRLVEIWRRIYKKFPDWEVLIVGTGEEFENLRLSIKKQELPRITLCGSTNNTYNYYNTASILCMTSTIESWGLVLTEAQQAGVIPIAFNCSAGVKEIIAPSGTNGFLVDCFDLEQYEQKLTLLMRNEFLRAEMQRNVMLKSAEYDIENVGLKWIEAIESALAK